MIWTIAAWISLLLGLALIAHGLFWDRPGFRGRPARRCRRCDYDLTDAGEVPVKCTECGRVHRAEKSLRRVRRHKRVVAVGLVVLVGAGVLSQVPRGLRGELFRGMPAWALVQLQPLFPERENAYKNHPSRELSNRLNDTTNPKRHAEVVAIIHALADGSVFAEAGSEQWARTSGRWFGARAFWFGYPSQEWHYPDLMPADEALRGALDRLMRVLPEWNPVTRDKWPEGYRVTIESGYGRPLWPIKGDLNERAVLRIEGHDDIVVDGFISNFDIGPIGEAGERIEADLELSYFRMKLRDRDESTQPVWTQRFPIQWEVVKDVENAVEIVADDTLLDAVKHELVLASREGNFYEAVMQNAAFDLQRFDDLGIGLRIALFDADEPITEWRLRWSVTGRELLQMTTSGVNYVPFQQLKDRIDQAMLSKTLRVSVVSDPQLAMENLDADRIWSGSFEMMYHEAVGTGEAMQEETQPETTGP